MQSFVDKVVPDVMTEESFDALCAAVLLLCVTAVSYTHLDVYKRQRQEDTADISENTSETDAQEAPDSEKLSAAEALILRMQKEIDSEENVETVENTSNYTDSNTDLPESERKNVEEEMCIRDSSYSVRGGGTLCVGIYTV